MEDEDEFDWFLNSGPTGTDGSGPTADHTKGTADGHYLYMEASQPRRPGDRARIISPVINRFNDSYCLVFFYHMSGADTASLTVIQRGDYYPDLEIARLSGPDGTGWKPYNVDVGIKYGPIEIVFTGVVGNSYRGDIALDDISLTPGPCWSPTSILCTFEYGLSESCELKQSTDDEFDWVWYDASTGETPPIDWSGYGSFMYADGTNRTSGDTAVLRSPSVGLSLNHYCLTFVFTIQDHMRLDVVRVGQDGLENNTLLSFTEPTGRKYIQYLVEGADTRDDYRILLKATVGDGNDGLVVLDHFNLYNNYCDVDPGSKGTEGSDSALTVTIVLGILLFVAIIFIAVGVRHFSNQSLKSKSFIEA